MISLYIKLVKEKSKFMESMWSIGKELTIYLTVSGINISNSKLIEIELIVVWLLVRKQAILEEFKPEIEFYNIKM